MLRFGQLIFCSIIGREILSLLPWCKNAPERWMICSSNTSITAITRILSQTARIFVLSLLLSTHGMKPPTISFVPKCVNSTFRSRLRRRVPLPCNSPLPVLRREALHLLRALLGAEIRRNRRLHSAFLNHRKQWSPTSSSSRML